ncbi:PREDICTED: probable tRNA (uracil-O(2)-)-methyltransferase [Nanorana parkeri]|uniref:probable tRNA (uracil-O(2)-)-methyltransferase n=1 Tax=Nanorana parkeri TaxID=125878 RepID=UPI000854E5F6|nr:PREDICTED: probable tRNA (uracil-O(2)-)-methyltransferase [Nanorana parkeri]
MPELGSVCVRDSGGTVLPGGFWSAVSVWLEKAQVLNKRLCGSSIEQSCDLRGPQEGEGTLRELLPLLDGLSGCEGDEEVLRAIRANEEAGEGRVLLLRSLIPKSNPHYCSTVPRRELVIKDTSSRVVTFIPLEEPSQGHIQVKKNNIYQIRLAHVADDEWSLSLITLYSEGWDSDGVVYPKISWMKNELLSKLAKWSTEDRRSDFKNTLSLIAVDKYSKLYQSLKEKYKDMVKVWPEVTDPEKFVYEDVAIATYLLILWEEERLLNNLQKKQSFIDLGCGNGLLVHILSNEEHPGRGIDVRKRKIWDMYGPQTILEEHAITPSDEHVFPDADWIIGNHSDELTPWLPVIAARSSYSCRYFVLPCCFFNFYGKFNRKSSKKTQYREYLDFVIDIGTQCGFNVEEDCLRIPSTKRVCLIGKSRTYLPEEEDQIDKERTRYIASHSNDTSGSREDPVHCDHSTNGEESSDVSPDDPGTGHKNWLPSFRPRDKVEQIRNCALLPRDFIDKVVLQVAQLLLHQNAEGNPNDTGTQGTWNRGRCLPIREVAEVLDKETLQRLKNECGGLQTLLRNNHQVFEVLNSRVSIRDWSQDEKAPSNKIKAEAKKRLLPDVLKTRLCWFYVNHPNGCPRAAAKCPYAHGPEELRPSTLPERKKLRSHESH